MHPSHNKLIGLWKIIVREISRTTGRSEIALEKEFKLLNEFFISVRNEDGSITRENKSVSSSECSFYELSELVRKTIEYTKESCIIDISHIETNYRNITGKELIDE